MTDESSNAVEPVHVERHAGWAAVVLNRPFRRNALTGPMVEHLDEAITELGSDQSIAAIVMRGEYGYFCSGIDLKELQAEPQHEWVPRFSESSRALHRTLFDCPVPLVVALEGFGINAGTALALAGDLIVAGESSFLQIGEIRQGAGIPMNAAWMRLKLSESLLARMAFMGDRVEAERLYELGVVHEVVADEQTRHRAEELAASIAAHSPGSSRKIKAAIKAQRGVDPDTWFQTMTGDNPLLKAEQVRS